MDAHTIQGMQVVKTNPLRKIEMFPQISQQQLNQQVIKTVKQIQLKFKSFNPQKSYQIYLAFDGQFILIEKQYKQNYCKRLYYMKEDGSIIAHVQTKKQARIRMFSDWQVMILEDINQQDIGITIWNLKTKTLTFMQQYKKQESFCIFPHNRLVCEYRKQKDSLKFKYYLYQQNQTVRLAKQYDVKLPESMTYFNFYQLNNKGQIGAYIQCKQIQLYFIVCDYNGFYSYQFPPYKLPNCLYNLEKVIQVNNGLLLCKYTIGSHDCLCWKISEKNFLWNYKENTWSDNFPNTFNPLYFLRIKNDKLNPQFFRRAIFIDHQTLNVLGSDKNCNLKRQATNPTYDENLYVYLNYKEQDLEKQNIPLKVTTVKYHKTAEIYTFLLCELVKNIDDDILIEANQILGSIN